MKFTSYEGMTQAEPIELVKEIYNRAVFQAAPKRGFCLLPPLTRSPIAGSEPP